MGHVRAVEWFEFQPFSSEADAAPYVGLRFAFDRDFVDTLKGWLREQRPHVPAGAQPGGWLPDARVWFVHQRAWPGIRARLREWGVVLVSVPRPGGIPHYEPGSAPPRDDAGDNAEPLLLALRRCQQAGVRLRAVDTRLFTLGVDGLAAAERATVERTLVAHRSLLVWLLAQVERAPAATAPRPPSAYDTLGVRPDTPLDEVRRVHREAIRRLHPDRIPNDMDPELLALATAKAAAVNAAFDWVRARHEVRR